MAMVNMRDSTLLFPHLPSGMPLSHVCDGKSGKKNVLYVRYFWISIMMSLSSLTAAVALYKNPTIINPRIKTDAKYGKRAVSSKCAGIIMNTRVE